MKFLTLLVFAAVLLCVVAAKEKEAKAEKEKVWYHAPMFKNPWKQAKKCFKEFRVAGCWDEIKNKFGDGAITFIERYVKTGQEPAGVADVEAKAAVVAY